jgi:hypothetical protein
VPLAVNNKNNINILRHQSNEGRIQKALSLLASLFPFIHYEIYYN